MSNLVFPPFVGWAYDVIKTPTWATRTQRAVSGREDAVPDYANPIWNFRLTFTVLRDFQVSAWAGNYTSELRKLMDFFNQVRGSYDTFLFDDPNDDSTIDEVIATADGVTCCFQLVRRLYANGFAEAIIAPNIVTAIKIDGIATIDYTVDSATGILTFPTPPADGAVITATFSFYFRCRFMTDSADFSKFSYKRWELKELRLKSIVL